MAARDYKVNIKKMDLLVNHPLHSRTLMFIAYRMYVKTCNFTNTPLLLKETWSIHRTH